ncbi:MAG: hypothetical protein SOI13_01125 [Bifidobacterium mongoliense]|jgi:heme exporter protein D|uniref:hypothetical protein n=1 Tax=Bifidobacterium mongoliense TaxID=518643 RepID=UPI002F35E0B9
MNEQETNPTPTVKKSFSRKTVTAIVVALVVIVAAALWGTTAYLNHMHAIQQEQIRIAAKRAKHAADLKMFKDASECETTDGLDSVKLLDDGTAIEYKQSYNFATGYECVSSQLKIPGSISDEISSSNAFSGSQTDHWKNIKVSWTSDGAYGFTAIFKLES